MLLQGSDREPGASSAEDASGRRSGRLSVKIRLKSAAQPAHSPGAHTNFLLHGSGMSGDQYVGRRLQQMEEQLTLLSMGWVMDTNQ